MGFCSIPQPQILVFFLSNPMILYLYVLFTSLTVFEGLPEKRILTDLALIGKFLWSIVYGTCMLCGMEVKNVNF